MLVRQSFDNFTKKISLDDTRKGRIQSAHGTIRDFLHSHADIIGRKPVTFLQGSYKLHTAVRPQSDDGSYDVDVVLHLNLSDFRKSGGDVMKWLSDIIKSSDLYKDKVVDPPKTHCVRLQYAGDFHMDITPAHPRDEEENGVILVANDWKESHPRGLKQHCQKKQDDSGGCFYKVVKLLKWWRNIRWGDEGHPKSIILTTLVGKFIPDEVNTDSLDEMFLRTLERIDQFLNGNAAVPVLTNPSLEKEVITASWKQQDYDEFKKELRKAVVAARLAFLSEDEQEVIDHWNSDGLFQGTFPKGLNGLSEAKTQMRGLYDTGRLTVLTSGELVADKGAAVPKSSHFGG